MEIKRTGAILDLGGRFRIEPGPALLRALATPEILSNDLTAAHYQAPRTASIAEIENDKIDTPGGLFYSKDALGQPIEIGSEMAYLDWVGFSDQENKQQVFYLYRWDELSDSERADRTETHIWREIGAYRSEEEALAVAMTEIGG